MTRREWVKEDDLARDLKVSSKHLRRVLVYLEQVRQGTKSIVLCTVTLILSNHHHAYNSVEAGYRHTAW